MKYCLFLPLLLWQAAYPGGETPSPKYRPDLAVFTGLAIPLGEFAETNTGAMGGGFAANGFNGEVRVGFPINGTAVSFILSGGVILNGMNKDQTVLQDLQEVSKTWNVPFLSGISVKIPLGGRADAYLLGRIGANLFQPPNYNYKAYHAYIDAAHTDETIRCVDSFVEDGKAFSLGLSAGFIFMKRIDASFNYLNLGRYAVHGREKYSSPDFSVPEAAVTWETAVSLINLNLGVHF